MDTAAGLQQRLDAVVNAAGVDPEIVVLAGRNYTDPIRDRLNDVAADYEVVDVSIRYPFDDTVAENLTATRADLARAAGVGVETIHEIKRDDHR